MTNYINDNHLEWIFDDIIVDFISTYTLEYLKYRNCEDNWESEQLVNFISKLSEIV